MLEFIIGPKRGMRSQSRPRDTLNRKEQTTLSVAAKRLGSLIEYENPMLPPRGTFTAFFLEVKEETLKLIRDHLDIFNGMLARYWKAPGIPYRIPPFAILRGSSGLSFYIPWPKDGIPEITPREFSMISVRVPDLLFAIVDHDISNLNEKVTPIIRQIMAVSGTRLSYETLNKIIAGIWNHEGPPFQYTPTQVERARWALPTLAVLPYDVWKAKVIPLLNSPQAFDSMDSESQELFLRAGLKTIGYPMEKWMEFNDEIIDNWNPIGRADSRTPLLVPKIRDVTAEGFSLEFVRIDRPLRLTKEQLYDREEPSGIPKMFHDYRFTYLQFVDDIDGGGFYYQALYALIHLLDDDIKLIQTFLVGSYNCRPCKDFFRLHYSYVDERFDNNILNAISSWSGECQDYTYKFQHQNAVWRVAQLEEIVDIVKEGYNYDVRTIRGFTGSLYSRVRHDALATYPIPGILVAIEREITPVVPTTNEKNPKDFYAIIFRGLLSDLAEMDYYKFPDSPFRSQIRRIRAEIDKIVVRSYRHLRWEDWYPEDHAAVTASLPGHVRELIDLFRQVNALGRRCANSHDPAYPDIDVNKIPRYLHIRLQNGVCWEKESLMEWIRYRSQGRNTSAGLDNYPSERLWVEDKEIDDLARDSLAKNNGFANWWDAIKNAELYRQISDRTIEVFERTVQLFVLRGDYFREKAREHLQEPGVNEQTGAIIPVDPRELEIFDLHNDNFYALRNVYYDLPEGPQKDLYRTVVSQLYEILRGKASKAFYEYYNSLSEGERNALESLRPGFQRDTHQCTTTEFIPYNSRLCQYIFANVILGVLNRVLAFRERPEFTINTSETGAE